MSQYKNVVPIVNLDDETVWHSDGDFYWPDPTKFYFWNGTSFAQNPDASVADLPDHMHWHKDYIENQSLVFEEIV